MSVPSDYEGGMALSLSDHDAEALLTGFGDPQEDLADVAEILTAIKAAGQPERAADFSHLFALAVTESRLTEIERFANEQVTITEDWRPRVMPRLAIGAAALFAIVAMSSGLAYAANGAKPGDMLYGLDRAFERVGIGNGGAGERLAEADALFAGGDAPAGLIHAAEVVAETPAGQTAAPAIEEAATRLENGPVGPGSNDAVQDLLDYIHGQHDKGAPVVGSDFGSKLAGLAQMIGERPDSADASEDAPGQNKGEGDEDAPGNSENVPGQGGGPPDSIPGGGPPDSTPGQGSPDSIPGGGPPDSTSGRGGPPDSIPGGGPPGQGGDG